MRIALLGAGTIARLVLEHVREENLRGIEVIAIAGRTARGAGLAAEFGCRFTTRFDELLALKPAVILEAASHDAIRAHLVPSLSAGVSMIVLSAGALADDRLRENAESAAAKAGAVLYVPSGGIGGLDALKAACAAGVEEVAIRVAKPPAAWQKIAYVEALGIDLDRLDTAQVLFDGPAREGVPHFPQNVNIAAVLALAGIGFERTRLQVVADPALTHNTHTIRANGKTGQFTVQMENVPSPDNPKTAWLACYSALAAIEEFRTSARYGT
jgi:aspartate dehydrogenase